jgi:outer membrane murein-binding lipoprotein Lpp
MATSVETKIKAFITPFLLTAFGGWFTANQLEIKSDVKLLLAHDNAQIIQIENLKSEVQELKDKYKRLEEDVKTIQLFQGNTGGAIKTKLLTFRNKKFRYESI